MLRVQAQGSGSAAEFGGRKPADVIENARQLYRRHAAEASFVHFVEARTLRISAISFDGDMTLWDFQKVMRHSLKHTLVELRRQVPTERAWGLTVDEMIVIRNRLAEEVKGKIWNLEEIRRLAFERTLERIGCEDRSLAVHLNEIYLKHRFEDIELYQDVLPALDILAPHFKIGLLSNGNSYPHRCGLEGRFAFVVLSQDVRVEKPDRRIFQITARRAVLSAGAAITRGGFPGQRCCGGRVRPERMRSG